MTGIRRAALSHFTRQGLKDLAEDVLGAMVSRDPAHAPVGPRTRYTENGQELAIGDGLWGTADRTGPYRHHICDTVTGNVLTFTTIHEGSRHSILVLRTKVADGALQEIEAMLARPDPLGGRTPFPEGPALLDAAGTPDAGWFSPIPHERRASRGELRRIANLYFAGLENNDGQGEYPFAADCERIENGSRVTAESTPQEPTSGQDPETPYMPDLRAMSAKEQFETGFFRFVTRIRERRFVAIDEELGVAAAFAFFDHNGTVRDYALADGTPTKGRLHAPFTWQIGEAFRIEDGVFTRIEAVMAACPYGMKSGWPLEPGDIA